MDHRFRTMIWSAALVVSGHVLAGCAPETPSAIEDVSGQDIFALSCAPCHGVSGQGDGEIGAALATPPPDLTKIAERRDNTWPMLEVMSIVDGYTKRTNPRHDMPIIASISQGPMVDFDPGNGITVPTPERLIALVTYIESIQSPRPERYVP